MKHLWGMPGVVTSDLVHVEGLKLTQRTLGMEPGYNAGYYVFFFHAGLN